MFTLWKDNIPLDSSHANRFQCVLCNTIQRVQTPDRSKGEVFAVVNTTTGTCNNPSLPACEFDGQMDSPLCDNSQIIAALRMKKKNRPAM